MVNNRKMTFTDYCLSKERKPPKVKSERLQFLEQMAELCNCTVVNVYNWMNQKYDPDTESKQKISAFLGVPIEILFPKTQDNDTDRVL